MKLAQLQHGKLESSLFKLGRELGESGAEVMARIDNDEIFRTNVAQFMLRGGTELLAPSTHITRHIARAIMGEKQIAGPGEIQRHLGIKVEPKWFEAANVVPYLPETLMRYRDTHLLTFGYPIRISHIHPQWAEHFGTFDVEDLTAPDAMLLQNATPNRGWLLVGKYPTSLKIGERLATCVEIFLALYLHKKLNNRPAFFKGKGGICEIDSNQGKVLFGRPGGQFSEYGLLYPERSDIEAGDDPIYITVVEPDNPLPIGHCLWSDMR